MQEVTIQYNTPKTLKFLKDVSKYFGFVISSPKDVKNEKMVVNGVSFVRGKKIVNHTEMEKVFTENKIDAKELRNKWLRKK